MSGINLQEDILPISELKRQASKLVDQVNASRRPVVLTRHGRGVAVLVSVEEFEELRRRADRAAFDAAVEEADADIAAGRVVDHSSVMARYRKMYGTNGEE